MARVFVSFAIEDKNLRDLLIGQKRNPLNPIEFTDFSVKKPWDSSWKTQCRARIKGCAGMIGIVTPNTPKAEGQLWELKCAFNEDIPLLLIHGHPNAAERLSSLPKEITGRRVFSWDATTISGFLSRL